ncbi:MAG: hypothetical protein J0H62_09875 [Rhizobiales bacterium]|nr:hypothetical protein [Hyphomicrobiales bacterium]
MRLYMFNSEAREGLRAFAADPAGASLPKQFAPWRATGVVREDVAPPASMSRATIEEGIAANGFQMWRMKKPAAAKEPTAAK